MTPSQCQYNHVKGAFLAAWQVLSVTERGQATECRARLASGSRKAKLHPQMIPATVTTATVSGWLSDNVSQDDSTPSAPPAFRLTPIHPMAPPPRVTSFLDLSGSSDASIRTRSNDNESSHRISSERQPTSRWSSTTAPSSHGHALESAAPSSPSSTTFPFPVSLPASFPSSYRTSTISTHLPCLLSLTTSN